MRTLSRTTAVLALACTAAGQDAPWLEPFLRSVPADAAAVAVIEMQPDALLEQIRSLLTLEELEPVEGWWARQEALRGALDRLEEGLLPRIGLVVRRNAHPDPAIPVETASLLPQVACVLWSREDMGKTLQELQDVTMRHFRTLGFEQAYELRVSRDVEAKVLEFTNRKIPGTGEIAMIVHGASVLVSNSGPFVRDLLTTPSLEDASLATGLPEADLRDPEPVPGSSLLLFHGRNLVRILRDQGMEEIPAEWMMALRSLVERGELRFAEVDAMSEEARLEVHQHVEEYLEGLLDREESVRVQVSRDASAVLLRLFTGR